MHPSVDALWGAYWESRGDADTDAARAEPSAWHFCDNQADADECAALVRAGKKRATAPSVWELEAAGDPLPQVGDLHIVTDWSGIAQCVIRTVAVEIEPFHSVSAEHAAAEGEGDGSLVHWRRVHRDYYRRVLEGTEWTFQDDMPIVLERFEVVFPLGSPKLSAEASKTVVGIDGCRAGWLAVRSDDESLRADVFGTFAAIVESAPTASAIFVDIPIGLREDDPAPRACDVAARRLLGPGRGSSVFPAPIRPILSASSHAEASAASRERIGKGISQQCFGLFPKIREVDEVLAADARARSVVREVHPELCFWALAGGVAMRHRKKTPAGFAERLDLLRRHLPGVDDLVAEALSRFRRKDVARDDIADALVALVTARAAGTRTLRTAPPVPERDPRGLPMEMVYPGERP